MSVKIDEEKLFEIAETYAYVIEGVLGYAWNVSLETMKESEVKNTEFIKANFVFALRHYLEETSHDKHNWKSIESAPKDGTHILTYCKNHPIVETWWKKNILEEEVWGGHGWNYPNYDNPTHWMPLPEEPTGV